MEAVFNIRKREYCQPTIIVELSEHNIMQYIIRN